MAQVTKTLFDNYGCDNKDHINIYSQELDILICDLDSSLLMSSFNFSQKTIFELRYQPRRNKIFYSDKAAKARLNEMLNMGSMQIFCKTLSSQTYTLNVDPDFTIYDIDLLVQHVSGIPPDCQRLICNGRRLDGPRTLEDYGIGKESTIHIIISICGGMYHETSGKNGNFGVLKSNIFIIEPDNVDI